MAPGLVGPCGWDARGHVPPQAGPARRVQDYVRKRESAGVAGAGLKIEGTSNGFQESSAHLDSTDRPLGTHVRIRRRCESA